MKSRTSSFDLALYKKDITRFAPLWMIYTVAMLLIMLSANGNSIFYSTHQFTLPQKIEQAQGLLNQKLLLNQ